MQLGLRAGVRSKRLTFNQARSTELGVLDHLGERNAYSVMNLKFSTLLIGLSTLLLVQTKPLVGQQIPASELPSPGTDTGLDGKYDPQNGIAQLIRGEYQGVAII